MRTFGPQLHGFLLRILQTTEDDELDQLREVSAQAEGVMLQYHPRQEAALLDTFKTMNSSEPECKPAFFDALKQAVVNIGASVSDTFAETVENFVQETLEDPDDLDSDFVESLAELYANIKKSKNKEVPKGK